jgi:hypothetical protein
MFRQWVLEYNPIQQVSLHTHQITSRTKRGPQRASANLWHKQLGHPGPAAVEYLVQQTQGVHIKGITIVQCDSCRRAKSKRQISQAPRTNDDGPGERLTLNFHTYKNQAYTKEKS